MSSLLYKLKELQTELSIATCRALGALVAEFSDDKDTQEAANVLRHPGLHKEMREQLPQCYQFGITPKRYRHNKKINMLLLAKAEQLRLKSDIKAIKDVMKQQLSEPELRRARSFAQSLRGKHSPPPLWLVDLDKGLGGTGEFN